MTREELMAKAPVGRLILRLASPTICAQLINALYSIVDRIYLGHIPGTGGIVLTGVGVTFPILMLITAFSNL
ncbi:MAG: MATE family efflux transporter, partial [Bullifex sp.]|nr:MATE family efflux transporter [Bullifex sp.]